MTTISQGHADILMLYEMVVLLWILLCLGQDSTRRPVFAWLPIWPWKELQFTYLLPKEGLGWRCFALFFAEFLTECLLSYSMHACTGCLTFFFSNLTETLRTRHSSSFSTAHPAGSKFCSGIHQLHWSKWHQVKSSCWLKYYNTLGSLCNISSLVVSFDDLVIIKDTGEKAPVLFWEFILLHKNNMIPVLGANHV